MPTVTLGVDAHKRSHTVVAVDAVGKKLGEKTVPSTSIGHTAALNWARTKFGNDLEWGIEDCRTMTALLERDLLASGQVVVRVPPHLMSRSRSSSRTPGKSDPIDALAVARAVLREPDLPRAVHDETSWTLKLLVDRRDDLVTIRRGMISRFLDRVHHLDPTHTNPTNWDRIKVRATLHSWLAPQSGLIAELARSELADIDELTDQIVSLTARITRSVDRVAPGSSPPQASDHSPLRKSWPKPPGWNASRARPPSRATPAPRRSPTGRADKPQQAAAFNRRAAVTGNSTPRCTASRSYRSDCPTVRGAPTCSAASTTATRSPRPSAHSNAVSRELSTRHSFKTEPGPPRPRHNAHRPPTASTVDQTAAQIVSRATRRAPALPPLPPGHRKHRWGRSGRRGQFHHRHPPAWPLVDKLRQQPGGEALLVHARSHAPHLTRWPTPVADAGGARKTTPTAALHTLDRTLSWS